MKHIYLLIFCLFTFGILSAQEENLSKEERERREKNIQAGNPFAKYGYKAKVATLSKGKYLEVHDLDSIVTIGTVRWNVNQNKIVGNIVQDTTDMYAQPIGDVAGRWLSPDPLSDEFPEWSPYTAMNDNPINFIDPTGMASEGILNDYGVDKNGNVSLLKVTDDSTDTLYAVTTDDEGNKNIDKSKGSVTVSKNQDGSSIVSDLANNGTTEQYNDYGTMKDRDVNIAVTDASNKNDAFNVFKFLSDNSNVEWSIGKIEYAGLGTNYQIGTYHMDNLSPGVRNASMGTVLGLMHSHPNENTNTGRMESLFGDNSVGRNFLNTYGSDKPYQVYFPSTGSASKIQLSNNPAFPNAVTHKNGIKNFKF